MVAKKMMNIQISSSTSTQSSGEEMDERNDVPSSQPGDRRRTVRNDMHASSDVLRKHAIAGKYIDCYMMQMPASPLSNVISN